MLLTAVAWLAVSNHCALAATIFSPQPNAVPICDSCHDEGRSASKSKPDSPNSRDVTCCKVLKATASDLKHNSVPQQLPTGSLDYAIVSNFDISFSGVLLKTVMPTGPPEARSFTEVVLNRSLFAHAPPVFVA